jgi:phenylacetate-CoA ligase
MALISWLIRKTTLPLYLKHRGEIGYLSYLSRFARIERLSSYDIHELQLDGLRKLMKHIYHNCSYYREIFRDIGATPSDIEAVEDLQKFPILTKEKIQDNLNKILAENIAPKNRMKSSTGGSTGMPLTFYRDHRCRDMKIAMQMNFMRWYGFQPGDTQVFFWGASQDYDRSASLKSRLVRNFASRQWFINTDDLQGDNFEKTAKKLSRLKPKIVSAYPNILYVFAQKVYSRGIRLKFPKVMVTAEQLFEHQRMLIEKVFSAEVFEQYGSREFGSIASECRRHVGMHYFAPGIVLETVEPDGKPSGNKLGNLLVTDLWNYAMPLVRYQVGDLVRMDHNQCGCGCKLPKIGKVAGRTVDAITKPNGEIIAGQALIAIIRESEVRAQTQIIQTAPDRFVIRYVSRDALPENKIRFIQSSFAHLFGPSVEVEFERVKAIEREKSGKFRYIKSEIRSSIKV